MENLNEKKQIEEMANDLDCSIVWKYLNPNTDTTIVDINTTTKNLFAKGYRKQSEGEWIKDDESKFEHRYHCSVCNFYLIGEQTKYCEECGAKMFVRITHTCPHNIPNLIPTIEEMKGGEE